jgi:hypothetical protein
MRPSSDFLETGLEGFVGIAHGSEDLDVSSCVNDDCLMAPFAMDGDTACQDHRVSNRSHSF